MPDYTPFYRAQGLVEQSAGGSQIYQNVLRQLNRQFGLQQRREQMRGEQMNLPAHLRFAISQQRQPELYGQYAGGLSRTAAQAPGIDIRKAQALAGIQGQVEQLRMMQEQLDLQKESQKGNWLDVLGTVGGLGLGVAGLMFPPAGVAGAALGAGTKLAGGGRPAAMPVMPSQLTGMGIGTGGSGFGLAGAMNWMNPMLARQTLQGGAGQGGYYPSWNPYGSVAPSY